MHIKLKDIPKVDVTEWHEHFKIFPRVIEGNLVFFEKVLRRMVSNWDYDNCGTYSWEYKLIERKGVNESKT